MKLAKQSKYGAYTTPEESESYIKALDNDVKVLYTYAQGRIRFGDGEDDARGENIAGEFHTFISSGTPDAENTVAHTIGSIPKGYIVMWQDKSASLYQGPSTGTAWTTSNVYVKCNVASVQYKLFLVK